MAISAPALLPWTSSVYDFLYTFDWDMLVLSGANPSLLSFEIQLCVGFFPCFINIDGKGNTLLSGRQGSISCLSGCSGIMLQSLRLECNRSSGSLPKIQVSQSVSTIRNASILNCVSDMDGGVIQSYNQGSVLVENSRFENLHTSGLGAAISACGSQVKIIRSVFVNCSAKKNGGAIWVSTYKNGYEQMLDAALTINLSTFENCTSAGSGGAVLAESNSTFSATLDVQIASSAFTGCAARVGGALCSAGSLVYVSLIMCSIGFCRASDMGGALSFSSSAIVRLANSSLTSNSAEGKGGGGLHLNDAQFREYGSIFTDNSAPSGGGGVMYWQGKANTDLMAFKNCGVGNNAKYGPCIASDYKALKVISSITRNASLFAGLPVSFVVEKIDAYGQVIISDNESLIEAVVDSGSSASISHGTITNESGSSRMKEQAIIDGPTAVRMTEGYANISIVLFPVFAVVSVSEGKAALQSEPDIYFQGLESETCAYMRSPTTSLSTSSGPDVCPPGYVLWVDSKTTSSGHGSCSFCEPGTYSLHPLSKDPSSALDTPSCITCPAGGNCELGGSHIKFLVGMWEIRNGIYVLLSCPPGHQLINSTDGTSSGTFSYAEQQCRPCLPGQYILDPNHDSCVDCPAGIVCPIFQILSYSNYNSEVKIC